LNYNLVSFKENIKISVSFLAIIYAVL